MMMSIAHWGAVVTLCCGMAVANAQATTEPSAETQIRKRDVAWEQAVQANDRERVLAFYTDDCVGLFTALPISLGKDSMRGIWQRILSRSQLSLHWKPTRIEVAESGELAYDFGTMALSYVDPNGTKVNFQGKYTVVWRKDRGEWRVALDMSNSDTKGDVRYNQ